MIYHLVVMWFNITNSYCTITCIMIVYVNCICVLYQYFESSRLQLYSWHQCSRFMGGGGRGLACLSTTHSVSACPTSGACSTMVVYILFIWFLLINNSIELMNQLVSLWTFPIMGTLIADYTVKVFIFLNFLRWTIIVAHTNFNLKFVKSCLSGHHTISSIFNM